jgi:hypothetical protein
VIKKNKSTVKAASVMGRSIIITSSYRYHPFRPISAVSMGLVRSKTAGIVIPD